MKFTVGLSCILLALVSSSVATPARGQGQRAGNGGKGGFGGFGGGNNDAASTSVAAATATASVAAASSSAAAGGNDSDPQSSLTLDPKVIATGFEEDGQQVPTAGQVASATSSNNFINFCLTVPNLPITNGLQVKTGSCNPAPMGVIAATTNMPSSKFVSPKNGDTIAANKDFTITMALNNLEAGNFVNAASNYYSAPQNVNAQGNIVGHTHVVIEKLSALDQTTPTDPTVFAFFKGVNTAQVNGVVTADVPDGLDAGVYRLASINAAANHQPVLVAVAQHGSLDDMVYFTVSGNGAAASNATAAAPAASSVAAAAPAASSKAAAGNQKGGNANAGGKGKNGRGRFARDY